MTTRIFIAAPRHQSIRAERFGELLKQTAGFSRQPVIVSRWHAMENIVDPNADYARLAQLSQNLADIEQADVLVALTDIGIPRATLSEIGYALGRSKPVVWVVGCNGEGRNLFDSHSMVSRVVSEGEKDDSIAQYVARAILRHVAEAA